MHGLASVERRFGAPPQRSSDQPRDIGAKPDLERHSTHLRHRPTSNATAIDRSPPRRIGGAGTELHPQIDDKSVRRFKASDVERLARELEFDQRSPRNAQPAVVAEIPKASLPHACSSAWSSHSLSEIVIALHVPPEDVRDLYHTWLVGLWAGELQRTEPALPARHTDQDVIRPVTTTQLAQLLAALPPKQSTRINLARVVGEYIVPEPTDKDAGFVEYRNLSELGCFDASGPITVADVMARVGKGEYRVSAYGFDPPGLRWEVFVRLGDEVS